LDWRCDIASGRVNRVTGKVKGTVSNSQRAWAERRGVALRLVDVHGRVGQGEASPLPGYSPDSLEQCEEALSAAVAQLPARFDSVEAALAGLGVSLSVPAARFAMETALFDLLSQREGLPVSRLLSDEVADSVPLAALCTGTADEILQAVHDAWDLGIRTVKLKIGKPRAFAAECELLARLRAEHGPELALRLDANAAWNPEEALERLEALAPFAPEFVEQPVAPDRLPQLASTPVAIAADESLHAATTDFERIFRSESCHVAVLKPMVLGGLLQSRRIARLARAQGVDTVVSHLFDGPIALAAAAELALALPQTRAAGLAPHAGLSVWPKVHVPQLEAKRIVASPGYGLGVTPLEGGM
jgi:o-succinylbenzoate synthase